VTKVHVDGLITCHVVGCSKLVTNWLVAKPCPLMGVEWIHIILWSVGVVSGVLFGLAIGACGGCWRC
jgi:hypothetical protein